MAKTGRLKLNKKNLPLMSKEDKRKYRRHLAVVRKNTRARREFEKAKKLGKIAEGISYKEYKMSMGLASLKNTPELITQSSQFSSAMLERLLKELKRHEENEKKLKNKFAQLFL